MYGAINYFVPIVLLEEVTALLEYLDLENHFYANYALKLHQNSGIIVFYPIIIFKIIPA